MLALNLLFCGLAFAADLQPPAAPPAPAPGTAQWVVADLGAAPGTHPDSVPQVLPADRASVRVPGDAEHGEPVGKVELEITVGADGQVTASHVVSSTLSPSAEVSCLQHAIDIRWAPAVYDGAPVAATGPFACAYRGPGARKVARAGSHTASSPASEPPSHHWNVVGSDGTPPDKDPQRKWSSTPPYPSDLGGHAAVVHLSIVVGTDGRTHDATVVSAATRLADKDCLALAQHFHWRPATVGGKPVAVTGLFGCAFQQ